MYKKIDLKKIIIYDIETNINSTIFCFLDYETQNKKQFVFYNDKHYYDQPLKLFRFLKACVNNNYTLLGFNVLNFDANILHEFYTRCDDLEDKYYEYEIKDIISNIYYHAQELVQSQNIFDKPTIPENRLFIPHIDVFKQLHYDRPAKATSLKWLEFSMRHHTIKEMPYPHDYNLSISELEEMLEYCWDDVIATLNFYNKVKFESELRLQLSNQYKTNLINASETKISKAILTKYITENSGISLKELKDLKTIRISINIKDIIFDYVKFLTPELNKVLDYFKDLVIDVSPNSKNNFKYSFNYKGVPVDLGLGGIHACVEPGIYKPNEDEVILDYDITSMYPQIAIQNRFKPEHLPDIFCDIYAGIFDERKKYDKKDPRNYVLKICLNALYGLSGEINSFVYDRKYQLTTTINGQLMLLMFCEALYLGIPDIKIIQKNTDGISFIIKKQYLGILDKIVKWWQNVTKLSFEHVEYKQMIIRDVNNYISEYLDGSLKKKGIFETEMAYHKNPSFLVIPKAVDAYFIKGIPIDEFIKNPANNDIFDFCGAVKKKSNFKINLIKNYNYSEIIKEQQKVCRYIVSEVNSDSGLLVKDYNDGRRISIVANNHVQPLDVIHNSDITNYKINYNWYINEALKIKEIIEPSVIQGNLF